MIILIEGPKRSGKTHLIKSLNKKTFKFRFDIWFKKLKLNNNSYETHLFALAKEIILHQLNNENYFLSPLIVDRGIITTLVWGILCNRITKEEAIKELKLWNNQNLFNNTTIIIVEPQNDNLNNKRRKKDLWDLTADNIIETEIFNFIIKHLHKMGIKVITINNFYNIQSILDFKSTIKSLCVES